MMRAFLVCLLVASPAAGACAGGLNQPSNDMSGSSCLLHPGRSSEGQVAEIDWTTEEIHVLSADGTKQIVFPPTGPGTDYATGAPTLSPEGEKVVVSAAVRQADEQPRHGLWEIDLRRESRALLFPTDVGRGFLAEDPAYSPDGQRIAFTYVRVTRLEDGGHRDTYEIWVMDADGENAMRIADGRRPSWSSDGKYLAFGAQSASGPSLGQSVISATTFDPTETGYLMTCDAPPS